jgi:hypothetical protein
MADESRTTGIISEFLLKLAPPISNQRIGQAVVAGYRLAHHSLRFPDRHAGSDEPKLAIDNSCDHPVALLHLHGTAENGGYDDPASRADLKVKPFRQIGTPGRLAALGKSRRLMRSPNRLFPRAYVLLYRSSPHKTASLDECSEHGKYQYKCQL